MIMDGELEPIEILDAEFMDDPEELPYRTGTGQWINAHFQGYCWGPWCVIHNPMPGPWDRWPTHWRDDRSIMERICPHGVGHPAVEQFDHWTRTGQDGQGIHGCCGVCQCSPNPRRVKEMGTS